MSDIASKSTVPDGDANRIDATSLLQRLPTDNVATARDLGPHKLQGVDDNIMPFVREHGIARSASDHLSVPKQAGATAYVTRPPLPRLLPSLGTVLFCLDLFLMSGAQALVFGVIGERLALGGALDVSLVVALSVLTTLTIFYASGCYQRHTIVDSAVATARVPVALGLGCGVLFLELHYGLAAFFPSAPVFLSVSRCITIVLLAAGISLCAAILARVSFQAMVHRHWFRRRILVIGTGQRALRLRQLLAQNIQGVGSDLHFVSEAIIGGKVHDFPRGLGNPIAVGEHSVDQFARSFAPDEIVVAVDDRRGLALEGLLTCKRLGIPVTDYQTFVERETGRVDLSCLEMSWLVYSNGFRMHAVDVLNKRCADILVSSFLLLVSWPILLVAIVAIWLEGYGHIFFKQERITQDGRRFWLYKLRTMRPDAEKDGAQWASENDPRVTRVGGVLRRTRIDELPQLINVLCGDMSLVGPRPERPIFVEQLSQEVRMYSLRHSVKSGLTGWAQISYPYGASSADALRKLEYDIYYIKNYSLLRDLAIILQTLRVLIWPPGVR